MADVDFHCSVCGCATDVAPDPPAKAICENCCDDHDYQYEREFRDFYCFNCGKQRPADWD